MWLLLGMALAGSPSDSVSGTGRVIDGDSLRVGSVEIRLHGVDAVEYSQTCERDGASWPCGARAKQMMGIWLRTGPVSCVRVDTDMYGRWVSRCQIGGVDLGRAMVLAGGAVAFTRYSDAYVDVEGVARAHRRGIWAGTFETPSDYRRK